MGRIEYLFENREKNKWFCFAAVTKEIDFAVKGCKMLKLVSVAKGGGGRRPLTPRVRL